MGLHLWPSSFALPVACCWPGLQVATLAQQCSYTVYAITVFASTNRAAVIAKRSRQRGSYLRNSCCRGSGFCLRL